MGGSAPPGRAPVTTPALLAALRAARPACSCRADRLACAAHAAALCAGLAPLDEGGAAGGGGAQAQVTPAARACAYDGAAVGVQGEVRTAGSASTPRQPGTHFRVWASRLWQRPSVRMLDCPDQRAPQARTGVIGLGCCRDVEARSASRPSSTLLYSTRFWRLVCRVRQGACIF